MATRINTKFVVILAIAIVLVGVGGALAVKKFIFKSAEQHAQIADDALAQGHIEAAAGNVEEANALFERAARRYNAAHNKDPINPDYVYRSIEANEAYLCTSETESLNRLSMVLAASQIAHDSPIATDEDRTQYYERLMSRHRMGLLVDGGRPWIANLYRVTDIQIQANENNDIARRWRGIAGVYMLRNDMPPEDRAVPLADLNHALAQNENDAAVLHHIALWHSSEAHRLSGTATTEASTLATEQAFALSQDFSAQSYNTDADNPLNAVSHIEILFRTPQEDEVRAQISQILMRLGHRLVDDADACDQLYDAEMLRVVGWLANYEKLFSKDEAEIALAIELALQIAQAYDDPTQLLRQHIMAIALLANQEYDAAIDVMEAGLALDLPIGARDYLLNRQTTIAMLYLITNTYITMAAQPENDAAARDALLDQSEAARQRFLQTPGIGGRYYQANADYLAGRAAFVRQVPHIAIEHLERANLFHNNGNIETLSLLAKAHDLNRNTGAAIEYYEHLLAMEPRATNERFRLVQLYLELGGDGISRAHEHISRFIEYNPNNVQARILLARVFAANKQFDKAAEVILGLDLEENPTLIGLHARYLAHSGDEETALALVRERLIVEANDGQSISTLFLIVTDPDQRRAELQTLIDNGLGDELATRLSTLIDSGGQLSIPDRIAMELEAGTPELDVQKAAFAGYQQSGQVEEMRATLAQLVSMAPNDKDVLEWQFNLAVGDKDWDLGDRLITQMLALDLASRPIIAASNGAFLKTQIQAGRILDNTEPGETPNMRGVIRSYQSVLEDNDKFAPGWIALGQVYLTQRDWDKARDAFDRAYRIQPKNLQAAIMLAQTMLQTGESDRALDLFREAANRNPGNRRLTEQYLQLESQIGVRRLALAKREELRTAQPQYMTNRRVLAFMYAEDDRFDEALAEIDNIIAIEGPSLSSTNGRAEIFVHSGQAEQGLTEFGAYIDGLGNDISEQDYLAYAVFLSANGGPDEANAAFQQAIALEDPATRRSSRAWAQTLSRQNQLAEASAVYRDLIRAFPGDSTLLTQLVVVQIAMQEYDGALSTLEGIAASPEKELLRAQAEKFRGDPEAALSIVVDAQRTYPASPELKSMQANLLTQLAGQDLRAGEAERSQERFTQALAIYEQMVEKNPRLFEIRVLIARIQRQLGDRDQAIEGLLSVLDEQPESVSARLTLFELYLAQAKSIPAGDSRRLQRAAQALSMIIPALEQQPTNHLAFRGAGEAAREAGQYRQSADYYQAAFDLSDQAEDLTEMVSSLLLDRRPGDAIAILDNPELAEHVRDSLLLRALQARALAATNKPDEARNLFGSLFERAESMAQASAVLRQLSLSTLHIEASQIVEGAMGTELDPIIAIQLAEITNRNGDLESVIRRLTPFETSPIADDSLQLKAMLMLSLAYQNSDEEESLLHSMRIYEQLLENPANRNNTQLYNNLAVLLSERLHGQDYGRQAVEYAQRAVELMRDDYSEIQRAHVQDTLGWAHFKAGDHQEAIDALKTSIETRTLVVNNLHLGLVYMSMEGQNNENFAMQFLDEAKRATQDRNQRGLIDSYMDQIRNRPANPPANP